MNKEQAAKLRGLIIETALLVEDLEGTGPARKFLGAAVELMSMAYAGKKLLRPSKKSEGLQNTHRRVPERPGSGAG
jgi:hypothetical protein